MLALLVGLYVSVNPNVLYNFSINQVSAWDDITTDPGGAGSGDSDTTEPSLSLTVDGADQAATPARAGEVAYRYNIITVAAKGYRNYDLTLSAMLGSGSELHGKNNPYATVEGVGTDVVPENFGDNTWGYAVTENTATDGSVLTYNTLPDYGDAAATLASGTNLKGQATTDTYKLVFAAKFGSDAPSDNYQGQLLVSVTGTPGVVVGLADITNMQEMTSEICANSKINETKQLRDTRDNKLYWVTKLADDNCWMTQNLDLDFSIDTTLTPEDSDVTSDWVPNASTMTGDLKTDSNTSPNVWSNTPTQVQSLDPGDYYYVIETDSTWTNCNGVANLDGCSSRWTKSIPANQGTHYHVGNFYSWNAATAGTGGEIISGEAEDSICPKGWKLPTINNSNTGSFQDLMNEYAITNDNLRDKVRQTPLFFIPTGYVDPRGLLYNVSYRGGYWSSTPVSSVTSAFDFYFYPRSLHLNSGDNRYYGYSVRCLVRAS